MMETEAKEDLDVVNDAMANSPESTDTPTDPLTGEVHDNDFASLSKMELVDLLKELVRENDFRKSETGIRALRSRYEDILHYEKTEALKRFLEQGGTIDDFDYRLDVLDIAFEANYKLLRNKRVEHFRNMEALKNENLSRKNGLLDSLRQLVDGEDDKHSFDKFKDIQKQWKEVGQVPMAKVRPLWASYHALVDRYYDNRTIYFELKELDRKKNLEAKLELCAKAEKLSEIEKVNKALLELHELHEEYKHIGPVSREDKDILWERFRKASDAVYERRDAAVAHLHAELGKNLSLKEKIIQEVTALAAFQSDRIKEWNQKTLAVLSIQKTWESIGTVPRSRAKEVNKQFWSAFKLFFNSKGKFFGKLDETRAENLEKKKELVKLADTLKDSQDWENTSLQLKSLQIKWKEIGPVPDKHREKIYLEFKTSCDFFFEKLRLRFEESDREQSDNLAKKESVCAELETVISQKSGSVEGLRELQRNFGSIGLVPRQAIGSIKSRFTTLFQQALASIDQVSQGEKDQIMLEIQLENLKSDPDGRYKIQQREQILRKRIQKEENDLATLKNNLEFFGRSKNADKMRAEFGEKIKSSESELSGMKQQLKQLRAASR